MFLFKYILGFIKSADNAIDYSNIDELADENDKYVRMGLKAAQGSNQDLEGKYILSNTSTCREKVLIQDTNSKCCRILTGVKLKKIVGGTDPPICRQKTKIPLYIIGD